MTTNTPEGTRRSRRGVKAQQLAHANGIAHCGDPACYGNLQVIQAEAKAKRVRSTSRTTVRERVPAAPASTWRPPSLGDLTFVDMFCGAGGSSLGLTHAGLRLLVGMNHWERAIETHSANFTYAEHLCEDVSKYPLRRLPRADILWASPICTEMSPAGGKVRQKRNNVYLPGKKPAAPGQGSVLDELGHVPAEGFERTRATHWNVVEATEIFRYKAVITENVADLAETWELFDLWLPCMRRLGYRVQVMSMNSAHIGDDGNALAPQWRDRIYCVFTRLDVPTPDVQLRPISLCVSCGDNVHGVQTWSKATLKRVAQSGGRQVLVGRYRRDPNSSYGQYWYTCPNSRCAGARVEPYVRPAAQAIDWTDLGTTIGSRQGGRSGAPLKPNTIERIKAGLRMYARPIVATVAGNTFERPGYTRAWPADGAPLNTQQCTGTDAVVCPPYTVNTNHDDNRINLTGSGPLAGRTTKIGEMLVNPPMSVIPGGTWADKTTNLVDEPSRTQMATDKGCEMIVTPASFLTLLRNHGETSPVGNPMPTVTTGTERGGAHMYLTTPPFVTVNRTHSDATSTGEPFSAMTTGNNHYLTTPPGAFYTMNYSAEAGREPSRMARPVGEPFGAMTCTNSHALVVPYYTKGQATTSAEPFDAVTTRDRFALVRGGPDGWLSDADIDELVEQCHYRMLKPEESLAAQRFDPDYMVLGNIGERTMQAGNAVSANAAQFLGTRVAAALCRTAATI